MLPYNRNLKSNARSLRKRMTPEERHLWYDFLKKLPLAVKRQHIIKCYIVDFYIAEKKIAIELDGIQHTAPNHKSADAERDAALAEWGITVLRYSNNDIHTAFETVADDILRHLSLSYPDLTS